MTDVWGQTRHHLIGLIWQATWSSGHLIKPSHAHHPKTQDLDQTMISSRRDALESPGTCISFESRFGASLLEGSDTVATGYSAVSNGCLFVTDFFEMLPNIHTNSVEFLYCVSKTKFPALLVHSLYTIRAR